MKSQQNLEQTLVEPKEPTGFQQFCATWIPGFGGGGGR